MIKASALLVALAIGLLVAGVLASSLLMVYVSIGVCAVAALLLAVGILAHWSDIFGRGESRPSGMQEPWPAVQVQAATPVLASTQTAGSQTTGTQTTGTQVTGPAGRERRHPRREDAGRRPPVPPVEVVPPQADVPAGRGDDLWERVEEELGSAGKRDTGALSWPGTELPVLPESAEVPGPPPAGASAWIWGHGAGWQPPSTPDDAWPPPAAAFAGAPARPEPAAPAAEGADVDSADADSAEADSPEVEGTEPADPEAGEPVPDAAAADTARKAEEAAPDAGDDGAAGPAPESTPVKRDAWDERPRWIISVGDVPAPPVRSSTVPVPPAGERAAEPATGESPGAEPGAGEPELKTPATLAPASQKAPAGAPAGQEPASGEPARNDPAGRKPAAGEADASSPDAREPAAEQADASGSAVQGPAPEKADASGPADQESAAEEAAADGPAGAPAPGRVEVTVVPGVARYHRSECILIRFLGADDLEIMTRQEAAEAAFVPCRACQPDQLES